MSGGDLGNRPAIDHQHQSGAVEPVPGRALVAAEDICGGPAEGERLRDLSVAHQRHRVGDDHRPSATGNALGGRCHHQRFDAFRNLVGDAGQREHGHGRRCIGVGSLFGEEGDQGRFVLAQAGPQRLGQRRGGFELEVRPVEDDGAARGVDGLDQGDGDGAHIVSFHVPEVVSVYLAGTFFEGTLLKSLSFPGLNVACVPSAPFTAPSRV
ncbi:hypothetical protein WCLP8_2040004 [uncultured Gammaproteobacteria bacterium]